jgi:hypothetical protein
MADTQAIMTDIGERQITVVFQNIVALFIIY